MSVSEPSLVLLGRFQNVWNCENEIRAFLKNLSWLLFSPSWTLYALEAKGGACKYVVSDICSYVCLSSQCLFVLHGT